MLLFFLILEKVIKWYLNLKSLLILENRRCVWCEYGNGWVEKGFRDGEGDIGCLVVFF